AGRALCVFIRTITARSEFRNARWGAADLCRRASRVGWFGAAGHERAGADGYVRHPAAGTNSEMSALQKHSPRIDAVGFRTDIYVEVNFASATFREVPVVWTRAAHSHSAQMQGGNERRRNPSRAGDQ